jgi:Lon protease-like protein
VALRTLPIFPLPLVLFPGVRLPLHIFEPRYRQMLVDCLAGDRHFGILFCPEGAAERELPVGHVGCVATIEATYALPDGRSNIVVTGGERFALGRFVESPLPYHVAEVTGYADGDEPNEALEALAARVRQGFERVGSAARALTDDRSPLPALPEDPRLVAYRVASVIDLDVPARQRLLASRSPADRLREIDRILSTAAGPLERRAATHRRAKQNGRGRSASP